MGWRNAKGETKRKTKKSIRTKTKFDNRGTQASHSLLSPSPQYKPAYEEDLPILRNLPPEPNQKGHLDCNRMEEERRKVLELLNEEFDLDYYSEPDCDSDSDTDYRYQMLV